MIVVVSYNRQQMINNREIQAINKNSRQTRVQTQKRQSTQHSPHFIIHHLSGPKKGPFHRSHPQPNPSRTLTQTTNPPINNSSRNSWRKTTTHHFLSTFQKYRTDTGRLRNQEQSSKVISKNELGRLKQMMKRISNLTGSKLSERNGCFQNSRNLMRSIQIRERSISQEQPCPDLFTREFKVLKVQLRQDSMHRNNDLPRNWEGVRLKGLKKNKQKETKQRRKSSCNQTLTGWPIDNDPF